MYFRLIDAHSPSWHRVCFTFCQNDEKPLDSRENEREDRHRPDGVGGLQKYFGVLRSLSKVLTALAVPKRNAVETR